MPSQPWWTETTSNINLSSFKLFLPGIWSLLQESLTTTVRNWTITHKLLTIFIILILTLLYFYLHMQYTNMPSFFNTSDIFQILLVSSVSATRYCAATSSLCLTHFLLRNLLLLMPCTSYLLPGLPFDSTAGPFSAPSRRQSKMCKN